MIEVVTVYDLRTGLGKEALLLVGEFVEEEIGHQGIQDGISQKFEALVVHLDIIEDKM
jgi:hypothetical protein